MKTGKMTKDQKDQLELDKVIYETWLMVRKSYFGKKLDEELDKIERQAIKKAMRGKTPQEQNEYMESRGAVLTVQRIRNLLEDIELDGKRAIESLQERSAKENKDSNG